MDLEVEICPANAADAWGWAVGCARAEAVVPFDLSEGPLLRVRVLEAAPDDHVVTITMHHIV